MNIENLRMSKMFRVRVMQNCQFDKQSIIYSLCIFDKSTSAKSDLSHADKTHQYVDFSRF